MLCFFAFCHKYKFLISCSLSTLSTASVIVVAILIASSLPPTSLAHTPEHAHTSTCSSFPPIPWVATSTHPVKLGSNIVWFNFLDLPGKISHFILYSSMALCMYLKILLINLFVDQPVLPCKYGYRARSTVYMPRIVSESAWCVM